MQLRVGRIFYAPQGWTFATPCAFATLFFPCELFLWQAVHVLPTRRELLHSRGEGCATWGQLCCVPCVVRAVLRKLCGTTHAVRVVWCKLRSV